jgi:hypothetical protein
LEAAIAVTDPIADIAARKTSDLLAQIEDFAEAQANTMGLSGLCTVSSRKALAQMIEEYREQNLPIAWDWEQTLERWDTIRNASPWTEDARRVSRRRQAAILRDIFGNPFRHNSFDPAWVTPQVKALVQRIYDDSAFDRLPHVADALEKAGCDNGELLAHCRGPGPHAKGCWVVDLLLAKG